MSGTHIFGVALLRLVGVKITSGSKYIAGPETS